MADRYILIIATLIYIVGTLLKINYQYDKPMPEVQYYLGSCILFIGSLLAEAATVAILAKVISPTLKRGFLNAGLLSGTADTLGRSLGNSSFTLFTIFGTVDNASEIAPPGEEWDYGIRAYSFYWYITATAMLVMCLITTILFLPKLQKYTIITIERNEEEDLDVSDAERKHLAPK